MHTVAYSKQISFTRSLGAWHLSFLSIAITTVGNISCSQLQLYSQRTNSCIATSTEILNPVQIIIVSCAWACKQFECGHFGLCMGGVLGGVDLRGVYNNTVQSEIQILYVHEALKPYSRGTARVIATQRRVSFYCSLIPKLICDYRNRDYITNIAIAFRKRSFHANADQRHCMQLQL